MPTEDGEIQELTEVKKLSALIKKAPRRFQKMLGIQKITKKRFMKLLMGYGIQRNDAEKFAKIVNAATGEYYSPMMVQRIIEWLIVQAEEARNRNEKSAR